VVVEGEGAALVGDQTISLQPRDIFVVPSWHPLVLHARRQMVLFGFSDKAAQQKLNLYKELCA
jgi:gentisate 1,2-dioxygenase